MDVKETACLQALATKARILALKGIAAAKSGHPGGSLSCMDMLIYLYNKEMKINVQNPDDSNRDRFVLSKGHAAPALYAALALKGFFPVTELERLRQPDSFLQGHPDKKGVRGVDMSTGSLGQGISAACGMALAGKLDGKTYRVYTIVGDGELQEGQVWEAMMFAAHQKLSNLCIIIDYNGLQIDGAITEVMSPLPIAEKLRAFGLNTLEIDGHDFTQIEQALTSAGNYADAPTAILMKTVKGKGVSYMENECDWHGSAPNTEQLETALGELNQILTELEVQING